MIKKRSNYKQPGLSRSLPGKHFLRGLLHGRIGRHRTRVEDVEDETPGSKVVRLLVVILFVHIVVIGGVALHGYLKSDAPKGTASLMGAVPAVAAPAVAPEIHITDSGLIGANAAAGQPAATAPAPALAAAVQGAQRNAAPQAAASSQVRPGTATHFVSSGETWTSIAAANKCTVADLRMVNAGTGTLASGMTIALPAKPGEAAPVAVEAEADKDAVYILQKGDTLARIARKYKTTTAKLMALNNLTEKDARRLRPGREIKLPQ